ncbi:hypothetical protein MnTg02_01063 [bacterium MnTg02]|nr:hypothetical protein MnTg02_01063 [bacterium MnTg02]
MVRLSIYGVMGALLLAFTLAGCGRSTLPHLKPLPAAARALLAQKGMKESAPIFLRIFKEESELELWKAKADGRYYHFKTYPICNWSGKLGPKIKIGDKQSPEGFYRVAKYQMNPNSKFHLSFNLGFPNKFDKSRGRTGQFLMVHGNCKSLGCYAMTDALIEEIYILAREAFVGGQQSFPVHAFPFRMTAKNMKRHRRSRWVGYWRNLKQGYDEFELSRKPPKIDVCERRYLINVQFSRPGVKSKPAAYCPPHRKMKPDIFIPPAGQEVAAGPSYNTPVSGLSRFLTKIKGRPINSSVTVAGP